MENPQNPTAGNPYFTVSTREGGGRRRGWRSKIPRKDRGVAVVDLEVAAVPLEKTKLILLADSCMRRDVNMLIFLDVRKIMEEGMKLYISDNRVILTEGFDGVVPLKYFLEIESWPKREPILF